MFDFMSDIFSYEDRAVARFEKDNLFVDTAAVSDGRQPYETAVAHPDYNGGSIIIVEAYATKDEAQHGHDKWVGIMTGTELPAELVDCQNAALSMLLDEKSLHYPRKTDDQE